MELAGGRGAARSPDDPCRDEHPDGEGGDHDDGAHGVRTSGPEGARGAESGEHRVPGHECGEDLAHRDELIASTTPAETVKAISTASRVVSRSIIDVRQTRGHGCGRRLNNHPAGPVEVAPT